MLRLPSTMAKARPDHRPPGWSPGAASSAGINAKSCPPSARVQPRPANWWRERRCHLDDRRGVLESGRVLAHAPVIPRRFGLRSLVEFTRLPLQKDDILIVIAYESGKN